MKFDLEVLQNAKDDIYEATGYYFEISANVFEHFNNRLDETLLRIQTNPYFEVRYKNIRALQVKNFSYLVLFEIDETTKTIYILSVFCTHQNPEKYP